MAGGTATAITDREVRALAAKLKGLHALLTPGEQVLLHTVLRRAAREPASADGEEVVWAVSFNPFPFLDAIVLDPPEVLSATVRPAPGTAADATNALLTGS